MKKLFLVVCFVFISFSAHAERFCVQQIQAPKNLKKIIKVLEFEHSPHSIYFLGEKFTGKPYILQGNKFKEIAGGFPKSQSASFLEMPDGTILGHHRVHFEPTTIYKQNLETGFFQEMEIKDGEKLWHVLMGWSTPLNGVLFATQGNETSKWNPDPAAVYLMQNNEVKKVAGIKGWITRIIDLPDLKMTFLGTEQDDTIYLIDANKNIHELGSLNLGEWIFFSNVYHLKNPDRLLVKAQETMGPFRGLFQINLEEENGVWVPSERQNFKNLIEIFVPPSKYYPNFSLSHYDQGLKEYFIIGRNYENIIGYYLWFFAAPVKDVPLKLYKVAKNGIEEIKEISDEVYNALSYVHLDALKHPNAFDKQPNYDELTIEMPLSNAVALITESGISVRDEKGEMYEIKNSPIKYDRFSIGRHTKYLPDYKAVFIDAPNGYFLLKDKILEGDDACTK